MGSRGLSANRESLEDEWASVPPSPDLRGVPKLAAYSSTATASPARPRQPTWPACRSFDLDQVGRSDEDEQGVGGLEAVADGARIALKEVLRGLAQLPSGTSERVVVDEAKFFSPNNFASRSTSLCFEPRQIAAQLNPVPVL